MTNSKESAKAKVERMTKSQMKAWADGDCMEAILEMEISNIDDEEIDEALWETKLKMKRADLIVLIEDCFYTVQKKVRAALTIAEAAMY